MMLLRSQSILYFNVKRIIWLKGYQDGNHIEPSEQRLQEISITKNWPRAGFESQVAARILREGNHQSCIGLILELTFSVRHWSATMVDTG